MAGDWIKMRTNLDTDPAVVRISSGLNLDRFAVVGRLHRIWSWANEHLTDGVDVPIDSAFLDTLVEFSGFADQLRHVGWLSGRDGSLCFPGFLRHNGASAKTRALDAERKRSERKNVRKVSGKCPDSNRTESGPEKRREEKSNTPNKSPRDETDFLRFWEVFPKKAAKRAAAKAWDKARKRADPELIIAKAAEFAASPKGQGEFCPHAATWLNGDRFDDDPATWQDGARGAREPVRPDLPPPPERVHGRPYDPHSGRVL
jgi:hypothetical protein